MASRNQIYNFGNPANNVTIRELALLMKELYEELTGLNPSCELWRCRRGSSTVSAMRTRIDSPDISKLRALGWGPRYDLRQTLREAMTHYLQCEGAPLVDRSGG